MVEEKDIIFKEVVEKFQCPGCTSGSDTNCGAYKKSEYGLSCETHSAGTIISGIGPIYLGMPKGFDRVGSKPSRLNNNIRIFKAEDMEMIFDTFNLPVWYQEIDGNLFVRTFMPRLGESYIDIFIDGKAKDINVKQSGRDIGSYETDDKQFTPINVQPFSESIR